MPENFNSVDLQTVARVHISEMFMYYKNYTVI